VSQPEPETQGDPPRRHWPKPLDEDAYIGFAGEFVLATPPRCFFKCWRALATV
jgi:hypothetical protein